MGVDHPNWIIARVKCNAEACLKAISEIMRVDAERMNDHIDRLNQCAPFEDRRKFVHKFKDSRVKVQEVFPGQVLAFTPPYVTFECVADALVAKRHDNEGKVASEFMVAIEWDADANECRLKIKGKEVEPWQVSRRALEPLFFTE